MIVPGVVSGHSLHGAHVHSSWEAIFLQSGRSVLQQPGKAAIPLSAPSLLLIPPYCPHMPLYPLSDTGNDLAMLGLTFEQHHTFLGGQTLQGRSALRRHLSTAQETAWQRHLFTAPAAVMSIVAHSNRSRQEECDYAMSLLSLLLNALRIVLTTDEMDEPTHEEETVRLVNISLRRFYYDSDFGLNALARQLQLAPTYLAGLYKAHSGRTIHQELIAVRIEQARNLLRSGRYRIKEVAALTGWSNQLYFSAAYKRYYGHPPSRERKG